MNKLKCYGCIFLTLFVTILYSHADGYYASHKGGYSKHSGSHCCKNMYVFGGGGGSFLSSKPSSDYENKPKSSAVYGGGIGYIFNEYLRADFSIFHRHKYRYRFSDVDGSSSQDLRSTNFMVSGYFSPINFYNFKPYFMAGIGVAHNDAGTFNSVTSSDAFATVGKRKNDFTWQVGGGTSYQFNQYVSLDLGYRYIDLGKVETSDVQKILSSPPLAIVISPNSGKLRAHEVIFSISCNLL